jgi:hypothetical protein
MREIRRTLDECPDNVIDRAWQSQRKAPAAASGVRKNELEFDAA